MKYGIGIWLGMAAAACALGPFTVQNWSGALTASSWDSRYERGLGAQAGVETNFLWQSTAALQLGYEYFKPAPESDDLPSVNAIDATIGLKHAFHPSEDVPVYPRLGLQVGVSQNWNKRLHLLAGVDAEGVVPLQKSWSLFAQFQPNFSWGADNQIFWRFALGVLFAVQP